MGQILLLVIECKYSVNVIILLQLTTQAYKMEEKMGKIFKAGEKKERANEEKEEEKEQRKHENQTRRRNDK